MGKLPLIVGSGSWVELCKWGQRDIWVEGQCHLQIIEPVRLEKTSKVIKSKILLCYPNSQNRR